MDHAFFMNRCLQLASNGLGSTYPNPLVGSVVVHPELGIIGEGWHRKAGLPHAEVEAISAVQNKALLKESTLYVNLEPCAHTGRTPPCSLLIKNMGIPRVVVGHEDPNPLVAGKGLNMLREAGVDIEVNIEVNKCKELNKRFLTSFIHKRPYVILKWAESADGFMDPREKAAAGEGSKPVSSAASRKLVHLWRSQEQVLVTGAGTVLVDRPQLNVRLVEGPSPRVVVMDRSGSTSGLHSFEASSLAPAALLSNLHAEGVQSVFVEAGPTLLNAFLDAGLADEIRILRSPAVFQTGLRAPKPHGKRTGVEVFGHDIIEIYRLS